MIEIKNLYFNYPSQENYQLEEINLRIEDGEFVAIVGNNGTGKSTLCKLLNGVIPHFIDGDVSGSLKINGVETVDSTVSDLAHTIGYVYQDFENQLIRPKVLDDAAFSCLNNGLEDYVERGMEALELTGLEEQSDEYIWQLSGGQKHLLALAGMTALRPDILILDEPIAQLDPYHALKTYDVLKRFNKELGKTIVVIEHHTDFIGKYCDSVIFMKDNRIQWKLPVKEALVRVEELMEGSIFPPQITQAAHQLAQISERNALTLPINHDQGKDYFKEYALQTVEKTMPSVRSKQDDVMIYLKDVSLSYDMIKGDKKPIFDSLNLTINKGERVALIGNNGAGKSTLLKLLTGLIKPDSGEIELDGKDIIRLKPEQISDTISYVYQNPENMFIDDSIKRDIAFSMKARNIKGHKERTEALLRQFDLVELAERDGRLLSGGQMRRASLAIGVALNPQIMLLDEPTANLDIATRKSITKTLDDLKDSLETTIIATHDMQLVAEWANRIVVLHEGKVIGNGTREEIFHDETLLQLAGIDPPEIFKLAKSMNSDASIYTVDQFVDQLQKKEGVLS
ncbi:ABC transporter ATP-binding protein [Carnobacterium inhibens]|uniref:ABC transporter ATP-binding protein n=1 Tax=Carnobacterium inhibens TaxID=147709 RepID=UPI00192D9A4D|nr:energy-coupling factor transporter ATPase [Carnobacterium inhibens]MCM3512211.1 energy-coupling factor transporter ATPase [Carnobacterium inhibens]